MEKMNPALPDTDLAAFALRFGPTANKTLRDCRCFRLSTGHEADAPREL